MNIGHIAGFFDGEGTIIWVGRRRRLKLAITNCDRSVLEKIKDFFGCGYIFENHCSKNPCFAWEVNKRQEIKRILSMLLPHLHVKQQRAKEIMVYLSDSPRRCWWAKDEDDLLCEWYRKIPLSELSMKLNRPISGIKSRASKLGLTRARVKKHPTLM